MQITSFQKPTCPGIRASVLSLLLILALCGNVLSANSAAPRSQMSAVTSNETNSGSPKLYSEGPNGFGVNIWISKLTTNIFGMAASDFDYHMAGNASRAVEAVSTLGTVHSTGTPDEVLVAFLNATMGGTMTASQGKDKQWLCNELGDTMSSNTKACDGVALAARSPESEDGNVEKRVNSRWKWVISGAHLASEAAMEILQRTLQNDLYESFSKSPRSWCNTYNSVSACISWSKVEDFNHYYAQQMVGDALTVVDFSKNSAQANSILGSRKRSGADVCLSNRAKGCT